MSKENFSKAINSLMYQKIKSLEYLSVENFFKKDEYFELLLCLAYMTLSKEKIIHKDMKNKDRMGRLTHYVDLSNIDKLFQSGFADEMPQIISARENNNLWILDNIRDSIMHGMFDIDEENKCFIINNTQYDRELNAIVPFSWFIAYAKNNILSQKIMDKYTITGFYYNSYKKKKKSINTAREVMGTILFNVRVTGSKFNVKDVEKRVLELFKEYSGESIDDVLKDKYRKEIDSENKKYNESYLLSFYNARDKVKQKIEEEFPRVNVQIQINNRKHKIINKISKRALKYYQNYDLFYESISNLIRPKSVSLLNYISIIIENLDSFSNIDYQKINKIELMKLINSMLNNESVKYNKPSEVWEIYQSNLKMLRALCLNVYGLATLVINHENLYSDFFEGRDPQEFGLIAYAKQPYLDYANKKKSLLMNILKKEIELYEKKEQLKKCTNEKGTAVLTSRIQSIESDIKQLECDLAAVDCSFSPYIESNNCEKEMPLIEEKLRIYYEHFDRANSTLAKQKIRKIIGKLFDARISIESTFMFGRCDMTDAIKIIRNSFSHIGRVFVGKNNDAGTYIILNDYDSNYEKSGEVICRYSDLINLLVMPLAEEKTDDDVIKRKKICDK